MSNKQQNQDVYSIIDKFDRTWGKFSVVHSANGEIHGYLKPSPEFEHVRKLFADHEAAFDDPNGDTYSTSEKILNLGAYLVDNASGNRVDIENILFINTNLLVTCAIHQG